MNYLASRLFGTPLLIHRPKLDVILSVVGQRIGMADMPAIPMMDMAAFQRPPLVSAPEGIAVIPIHGSLVKRSLGMEAASGLTSYGEIATMLDAALADPQVSGILLDIDSPGGEASGSFELARRVREVAALKPVWAVANDAAYSAAYAIAASSQRLFVTETGGVGSIGVIALHVDQSIKDAKDGYHYTAITAGAHKNDYSPHEPLSDAAKTELQGEVDRLYAIFTEHVAAMRGLDLDVVRATEAGRSLDLDPDRSAGMRLLAALSGELDQMLAEEVRIAEQAVTRSIHEATDGLKTELRSQITGAGLGQRLANTWRGEVYPKGKLSIKAAGLVYSRAPEVVGAHDRGATIRSKDGFWLAIPLPAAGKGPRGKRMTPGLWEKLRGQRLRFIYRRGKPSLLVAENQRARQGQRGGFSAASQKSQATGRGLVTVPMFLLVPQVTLKKKFDIDSASRRWVSTLATRIANRFDEAERQGNRS